MLLPALSSSVPVPVSLSFVPQSFLPVIIRPVSLSFCGLVSGALQKEGFDLFGCAVLIGFGWVLRLTGN